MLAEFFDERNEDRQVKKGGHDSYRWERPNLRNDHDEVKSKRLKS